MKHILIIILAAFAFVAKAQMADSYVLVAYIESKNELLVVEAIHLPSNERELGVLTLSTKVFEGKDQKGPKIIDLFHVYDIEAFRGDQSDYYYTLKYDYNIKASQEYTDTIEPDGSNLDYNYLPLDLITSPKIQFNEEEMRIDLELTSLDMKLKAYDLDIGYDELKAAQTADRTDINEAEKVIVANDYMLYRYEDIDEETNLAYEIFVRIQEQSSDPGVFDVFGRYHISKVKKGVIQKSSGNDYFDYEVKKIDFLNETEGSIEIDVEVRNYDNEKNYKEKSSEAFQKRVTALKENKQWILTEDKLVFTDQSGTTYEFERVLN